MYRRRGATRVSLGAVGVAAVTRRDHSTGQTGAAHYLRWQVRVDYAMPLTILAYHDAQTPPHRDVCTALARAIAAALPDAEHKVWHGHPVWFLSGNPIVGYSAQKPGIRLMFWSGADFDEPGLPVLGKKFKDASVFFNSADDIPADDLARWLGKARDIQWDYANIVKRKGRLERLPASGEGSERCANVP